MNIGAKAKALHSKIADKLGNAIHNSRPSTKVRRYNDYETDMKREKIIANRDARKMGY
jgi:hypothetical protein